MGDVSADENLQSSLNCFCTKPGILSLLRNRLRLNDVTLSISSGGLTWSVCMVFDFRHCPSDGSLF